MIAITAEEVGLFARLIHDRTGIALDLGKAYLLENRLAPLLEEAGVTSFGEFFRLVARSSAWVPRIIDAIATNETSFFRDQRPFSLLRDKLLPELLSRRRAESGPSPPTLRVWSAACSTGQEAYSVGMIVAELLGAEAEAWQVRIVGTDISSAAVVRAREGVYSRFEVDRGVPDRLRDKYFTPLGERLRVEAGLRAMSVFLAANLLAPPDNLGQFDLIFCRNVGIYFNQENRRRLFANIARHLRSDGALFIGSTESLLGVCDLFVRRECLNSVYFQPRPEAVKPASAGIKD
ncbi:MAG: protein-glutamate O-methyltransferase CheR [Desulfobacteraceae bacterium]|nr:protein-glutamate O-methyltransferase CheR [Desulfobacteraceae bacterium]